MAEYDGKRIVIIGGTTGIGLTTAKYFTDRGARVLVTGRSKENLDTAATELGTRGIAVRSDTTSMVDIDSLADRVRAEFGSFDVLFVNAGITRWVPFEAMDEATYDELLGINAKGPYFTVQRLAPLLVDGGAVVLTTSVVDEKGVPLVSGYSASKAALRSMARTLAGELVSRGIRVNAVSPGGTDTGILAKIMSAQEVEKAEQQLLEHTPMKRSGKPEEVAKAVAFLAFDATYTTGAELPVDGGYTQL
ncbi:SDR family oxidoreductase [Sciscionella sediminilitoris]|uniref:SDR family oxidoreductase n=1 Tax=Sciscionella sediminilitoris TaxID=1445613 RepID=UPI0004DF1A7E|nr:SDR family oxidoreductase [Sciscionella sp. SE31]